MQRKSARFPIEVAEAMRALRGYPHGSSVPADVRNDVFHTMDRHAGLYWKCFWNGCTAETTAALIQRAEWNAAAIA